MNTNDFDFNLPEELITQTPFEKRNSSKLLVIDHKTRGMIDAHFDHILDELDPRDTLVMNNTRVFPARLYGEKPGTHGHVELLLLEDTQGDQWGVLAKPAKHLHIEAKVSSGDERLTAAIVEESDHDGHIVEFAYNGIFLEILESLGEMPLPPYIREKLGDPDRHQTVHAKENGSTTAPTAGLHFIQSLFAKIEAKGVKPVCLTLHVGLGTFRLASVDNIEEYEMHSEFYTLFEEAAQALHDVKATGRRVVAIGATSIRALETIGSEFNGDIEADSGWTNIFIKPGYEFKVADAFSTNFHLPKSTLVTPVSVFAGHEFILDAYQHTTDERYRFFSFGDAMFVR